MTDKSRLALSTACMLAAPLLASLLLAPPADAASNDGKRVFLRCVACHTLEPGGPNKVGPNLSGVVGRKAGRVKSFRYSPAMTNANLTWDEATLDKWLARPGSVVPGTTMAFPGLSRPQDRKAVIELLKTARP